MYDAKDCQRMSLTVFTNAVLIDCTGADPMPGAAVVVEDDRIQRGRPEREGRPAPAARDDTRLRGRDAHARAHRTAHVHICAVEGNITDRASALPAPEPPGAKGAPPRRGVASYRGSRRVRDAGGADTVTASRS